MSKLGLFLLGLPGFSFFALTILAAEEGHLPSPTVLIVPIIVIIVLVLVNGLFVAAEFAIIGVRPTQLTEHVEEGNQTARHVLEIVESRSKQDQYIATAQLGITIASLGLAMYGEPQIAHFIEPYFAKVLGLEVTDVFVTSVGYIIALSLLTYLHIVIGEMVPKTLSLTDSVRMVLWLSGPMSWAQRLLSPFVLVLNAIGNGLLRLFGVPPAEGHERVLSPEELELLVTESAEGGLLKEGEGEMIRNIFDFSDRTVEQAMTPRMKVQALPCETPYQELLQIVAKSKHSRFPVFENDRDHIIGILHIKDLMEFVMKPTRGTFDLRLILREAPSVPEDYPIETLLAAFKASRQHMAIVLDEYGGMSGVVTLEDLVEEVVGEVRDEFDTEKDPFVEVEPGRLEVAGSYLVRELMERVYLGEEEALPDVETVGGLVVSRLGRLPRVGDSVVYGDNVQIDVIGVEKRAVSRVRIHFSYTETDDQTEEE